MKFFDFNITRILIRLIWLVIPYQIIRFLFYWFNPELFNDVNLNQVLESFFLGCRFDLSAIILTNLFFIIFSIIPFEFKFKKLLEKIIFFITNGFFLLISLVDLELFNFTGKRMGFDIIDIINDIKDQLPQLTAYYWPIPVLLFISILIFWKLDSFFINKIQFKQKWHPLFIISDLLFLAFCFVIIRGGIQHKSITIQSAFTQGKNELGHLVLNTPYHFIRTSKNKKLQSLHFFTYDEIRQYIQNTDQLIPQTQYKNHNVVLIILESFSLEYVEKGYTPFLNELIQKSLFFDRHLANGRRSIESLPSFLNALPSLLDEPISTSKFQSNRFQSIAHILKKNNYQNLFFHGGAKGTMGFESYCMSHGFDRYFSKEDFPDFQSHFDGQWGVFDEPFLQFTADELNKAQTPFFAGIFTLSSHQPYTIPQKYDHRFTRGTLEIHQSIGYTDYALSEFFNKIKKSSWYNNTLFIITADHTQKMESKKFSNSVGKFRVPLILFHPGINLQGLSHRVTQHSDIPKSICEFVGVHCEGINAAARSVWDIKKRGFSINRADEGYFLVQGDELYRLNALQKGQKSTYNWETGSETDKKTDEVKSLKAYLQYFINGFINNSLFEKI